MESDRALHGVFLEVQESPQFDVGLGRARVDEQTRSALRVNVHDIIEIIGKKTSAAIPFRLLEEDEGAGILRIDGIVRRNVGVAIGDRVQVRKAVVSPAEGVTIAPIISKGHAISFGGGIENFVKRGLLKRPLTKGDVVIVPGIALMGGALPFMVINTTPSGVVTVSSGTSITLSEEPVRDVPAAAEGAAPTDTPTEFVKRLDAVLEEYWTSLDGIEGEAGVRARKLRDDVYSKLKEFTFEDDSSGKD